VLNAGLGWWWADPAAAYVLVYYAAREVREIFSGQHRDDPGARDGADDHGDPDPG
jgi:hypothetical protein